MIAFLQGKKTYIIAAVGAVVWAANFLGYVSAANEQVIFGLLGIGAVATLRAAIAGVSPKA